MPLRAGCNNSEQCFNALRNMFDDQAHSIGLQRDDLDIMLKTRRLTARQRQNIQHERQLLDQEEKRIVKQMWRFNEAFHAEEPDLASLETEEFEDFG